MKLFLLPILLLGSAGPAAAQSPGAGPVTTPVAKAATTFSGQPILLPQGPAEVTAQTVELPAGSGLPAHKHPHQRFAYVLGGRLKVTNLDTGEVFEVKAGDFAVEARDQWHRAEVVGADPVRLLVVDQTPPGAGTNVVKREP